MSDAAFEKARHCILRVDGHIHALYELSDNERETISRFAVFSLADVLGDLLDDVVEAVGELKPADPLKVTDEMVTAAARVIWSSGLIPEGSSVYGDMADLRVLTRQALEVAARANLGNPVRSQPGAEASQ